LQRLPGFASLPQELTTDSTVIDPMTMTNYGLLGLGNGARSVAANVPGGRALGTLKDQLLMTDGARAYAQSLAGWIDKGVCEAMAVSSRPIIRNTYLQAISDMAVHPAGITVYTWEDSRTSPMTARYSIFDSVNGQPIVSDQLLGVAAYLPKPMVLGNYVVIVYYESDGADRLRYVAIPVANATSSLTAVDLASDPYVTTPLLDVAAIGGSIFVTYRTAGGAMKAFFLTPTLVLGAAVTVAAVAPTALGTWGDASNNLWVAYYSGTTLRYSVWSFALVAVLAATTIATVTDPIYNICGISPPGERTSIYYECNPAGLTAEYEYVGVASVSITAVIYSNGVLLRSVGLTSKAFWCNGQVHVLVAYWSALQKTYFLLAGSRVVAKLAPGLGYGRTLKAILPEVVNPSPGVYETTYMRSDRLISVGGNIFTNWGIQVASFDFNAPQQAIELSDNLHLTGGILYVFDGVQTVESGFHLFPEGYTATPAGTGGVILAGTYQYRVMFEWMDNYGCLHRSAPGIPVSVTTTGSTSSVVIVALTLRITAKSTPISIVIYRTAVNQTIFYRITSIIAPLLNSTAVDTVTFTDTVADASIIGNEQLYTTGGELENIATPAPGAIAKYKNRLVLVDAENPSTLWYSKEIIGGVPVEFNDALLKSIPQGTSDGITAMLQMDDKLVLFDSEWAYVQFGDGWAADGSGDNLTIPQALPTASGCTIAKSLAVIPKGLMFRSEKGTQLLTRGLDLQYVGAPVEQWNGDTVTSVQVIPHSRQVRYTLNSGICLVYDYYVDQWGTRTHCNAIDSVIWQNLFTFVQADGKVMQETENAFTDDGAFSPMKLKTSWLSMAGLQGFERVRRLLILGEYRGPHKLTVEIAYDFNPEPTQSLTIDAGTLLDTLIYGDPDPYGTVSPYGGDYPLYQWRIHLERQKCEALQVTITDSQVPPYSEGMSLSAITLEVALKKGARKMSAARSFS
jgi:hypothetical protein